MKGVPEVSDLSRATLVLTDISGLADGVIAGQMVDKNGNPIKNYNADKTGPSTVRHPSTLPRATASNCSLLAVA